MANIFCGLFNLTNYVEPQTDLSLCMQQIALVWPLCIVLTLATIFFLIRHRNRYQFSEQLNPSAPWKFMYYSRQTIGAMIIGCSIAEIAAMLVECPTQELINQRLLLIRSAIFILTFFCQVLSQHLFGKAFYFDSRGPRFVPLLMYLLLALLMWESRSLNGVQLRNTVAVELATIIGRVSYARCALLVLFLATFIPILKSGIQQPKKVQLLSTPINDEDDVTTPLLISDHRRYDTKAPTLQLEQLEDGSSWFSRLLFLWIQPLLQRGASDGLCTLDELPALPSRLNQATIDANLTKHHYHRVPSPSTSDPGVIVVNTRRSRSLFRRLNCAFGWSYYPLGILKLLIDASSFAGPIFLNCLVDYLDTPVGNSSGMVPFWHPVLYSAGLLLSAVLVAVLTAHFNYLVQVVGLQVNAALVALVWDQTLAVPCASLACLQSGSLMNYLSTDVDRLMNFCPSFHQFWSLPIQIVVAITLLYQQVGIASLTGLAFALLLIPINKCITDRISKLSRQLMAVKDRRVTIMSELFWGIRSVKMWAWEKTMAKRINRAREDELKALAGRKYLDALCVFFWATTPVLISLVTFVTYVQLGYKLTAAKVFTSLALFSLLIYPLNAFPWVINGMVEAWVSLQRLDNFLKMDAMPQLKLRRGQEEDDEQSLLLMGGDARFAWRPVEDGGFQLDLGGFRIEPREVVGIIGTVGSGKSALLRALLGEMHRLGRAEVEEANASEGWSFRRRAALVTQDVWLQRGTLKENVLFGADMDLQWYQQVLHACCLEEEIARLPHGDATELGESGTTLSGGQRTRLSLARAIYSRPDLLLLDEPLAAVDAPVAEALITRIVRRRLLPESTILLVTHHTGLLLEAQVHRVLLMDAGRIVSQGPPEKVISDWLSSSGVSCTPSASSSTTKKEEAIVVEYEQNQVTQGEQQLSSAEYKESGAVDSHVYQAYAFAVGLKLTFLVLLSLLLMQASRNVSDWWLSYWVAHSHPASSEQQPNRTVGHSLYHAIFPLQVSYPYSVQIHGTGSMTWLNITSAIDQVPFYLTIYGCIGAANCVFTLFRAFLFAYGGLTAARRIHKCLLKAILMAPLSFFEATPLGRLLNRFSSDLATVDDALPFQLNIFLAQAAALLGSVVITCLVLPSTILLLLPLIAVYWHVQAYYRRSSRELKRLGSLARSPLYALFAELEAGLPVIRADGLERGDTRSSRCRFAVAGRQRLRLWLAAQWTGVAASCWLGLRLQLLGAGFVLAVLSAALVEHVLQQQSGGGTAAFTGLAATYALSVTSLLGNLVASLAETEKEMVAAERCLEYVESTPAEEDESAEILPSGVWPSAGALHFFQVSMRYRSDLKLSLDNVSLELKPGERLGVVGRTGAGKSSLLRSLLRLTPLAGGRILVDGVDLARVPRSCLRSRFCVIPQDPFLFNGSLRENLDPDEQCTDAQLLNVLHRCRLDQVLCSLGGLDGLVGERGACLSAGQRQLVCLARGILRNSRLVALDEATACVDIDTEITIRKTLLSEFRNATLLVIAHRLDTVMALCQRVAVFSNGQLVEYGDVNDLARRSNSQLSVMLLAQPSHWQKSV